MYKSMRKSTICRFGWLLLVFPWWAHGAEVTGLYEAEVQVFSQKSAERATAMVSALAEVLAKVSGQRNAALNHGVAEAIRQPGTFLQQYRYLALPDAEKLALQPGDEPQLILFRFDKEAVDKALRDNGLPVWGAVRPATLVWLAVEDAGQRFLLGSDMPEPVRRALDREARRRGLAVVLPLLDLEDQARLRFADVWGNFNEPIMAASVRYRPEAVLVGRMQRTPAGEWTGNWTLLQGDASQGWESRGVLAEEVVDAGIAGVVEALAARYAHAAGQQAEVLSMTVTSVHGLRDYARVIQYLQSLQQVTRVQPLRVDAEQIGLELGLRGDAAGLAQTISLGRVLAPVQSGQTSALVYQLMP